jgi:hypothetical protein
LFEPGPVTDSIVFDITFSLTTRYSPTSAPTHRPHTTRYRFRISRLPSRTRRPRLLSKPVRKSLSFFPSKTQDISYDLITRLELIYDRMDNMDEASGGTRFGVHRNDLDFTSRSYETQVPRREDRFSADTKPSQVSVLPF